ncbi:DNA-binding response regulator [Streptomyces sp. NPDC093591]|uniref:response regulator transcription factor n=1 Tax=Streptomyces sp. NPDC093591 TaxID=3366044 RepID=UPI0038120EDF
MTATTGFRNGRVRVLIVDDEPALTDVLSGAVEEAGWRPYPALDGQSALRIARGCPPHAVVLDGMLPDPDGLQVLRRLRYESPELRVLSKSQILDHVWSSSFDGGGNLVEVYLSGLRRKIDKGRAPMIHTVRGLGYAIRPVEDGR